MLSTWLLLHGQGRLREREARARAEAELAAETMRESSRALIELAQSSLAQRDALADRDLAERQRAIGSLVEPVVAQLGVMERALERLERDRATGREELAGRLGAMAEAELRLETETRNLAKALRNPSARGRWGELHLARVVEIAGLTEHCDFSTQTVIDGADGRLRPDMVIHLPGERAVVVDAKAPLGACLDAAAQGEPPPGWMADHARQVRAHVDDLAARGYQRALPGVELVVMFLPGEGLLAAALEGDPELLAYAARRNVMLASPSSLIALLRAIAHGWDAHRVALNADEIREVGRQLHERIATFAGHLDGLRRGLEAAVAAYNKTVGSLEKRLAPAAQRLSELGAGTDQVATLPGPVERRLRGAGPSAAGGGAEAPGSDRILPP